MCILSKKMLLNVIKTKYKLCNVTFTLPVVSRFYANKFYKTTNIIENNSSYSILIDNKLLKTPFGKEVVTSNRLLALGVAEEWNMQKKYIEIDSMHLTKLCFLAVDNENVFSKQEVIQQILSFLETDTVLFFSDTNKDLNKFLTNKWYPIIEKFNGYFNTHFKPYESICIENIDFENMKLVEKYLLSLEFPALYGVLQAVETLKSVILTICCLNQHISVEEAVLLSKMEEEYQCTNWQFINWIQNYSYNDSIVRLSAAILFIYSNTNQWLVTKV